MTAEKENHLLPPVGFQVFLEIHFLTVNSTYCIIMNLLTVDVAEKVLQMEYEILAEGE